MFDLISGRKITRIEQCTGSNRDQLCRNPVYDGSEHCRQCKTDIAIDAMLDSNELLNVDREATINNVIEYREVQAIRSKNKLCFLTRDF